MKLKKIHPRTTKLLSSTGRGGECACVFLNVYRSESDLYPCDRGRVYGSKAIQFGEKGPLGKKNIKAGSNLMQVRNSQIGPSLATRLICLFPFVFRVTLIRVPILDYLWYYCITIFSFTNNKK